MENKERRETATKRIWWENEKYDENGKEYKNKQKHRYKELPINIDNIFTVYDGADNKCKKKNRQFVYKKEKRNNNNRE